MRILFLSSWFPSPPINGAKVRVNNLLRYLVARHDVTLVAFVNTLPWDEVEKERVQWGKSCARVFAIPRPCQKRSRAVWGYLMPLPRHLVATYSTQMERAIEDQLKEHVFDVVIASEVGPAAGVAYYAGTIDSCPKVLDGLEIGMYKDRISHTNSVATRIRSYLTWFKFKFYLRNLSRGFDACTVPSLVELDNVRPLLDSGTRLEVMPHGLDLDYLFPNGDCRVEPNSLVYNGSLTYFPNKDAVEFFLREIWPITKQTFPDIKFRILGDSNGIGGDPRESMEGVEFRGPLRDIRPEVWCSWASVVPMRQGAGTRLKIIESMALGTPVVSTSKGAEGLDVTPDVNILIADDPGEFAAQTLRLLRSPELRAQLSKNGRRLVEDKYNCRLIGDRFNHLIESVVSRRQKGST